MPNKKLREYGSPIGVQEPGATNIGRPTVGPADPETRRKALQKALGESEAPPPKPVAAKPAEPEETRSLGLDQAARNLRKHKLRTYELDHDEEVK